MMDLLCTIPAPSGNEENVKKYIRTKLKLDCTEDAIGNLILHKAGGGKRVMVYCAVDEDALVAMHVEGKTVSFAHIGARQVLDGDTVSFGGYKGVVCAKDAEKPQEEQTIQMLVPDQVKPGDAGVLDGDFYEEDGVLFGKMAGQRAGVAAMMNVAKNETPYDLYLVFGVQGCNRFHGLVNAARAICPEEVLLIEEAEGEQEGLVLKLNGSGFIMNQGMQADLTALCEQMDIPLDPVVDAKEKTGAALVNCGRVGVIAVPVRFTKKIRQAVTEKQVQLLEKLISAYIKGN